MSNFFLSELSKVKYIVNIFRILTSKAHHLEIHFTFWDRDLGM